MNDFDVKPRRCKWTSLILMSIGLLLSFASPHAFAFNTGNVSCTTSGNQGLVDLGVVAPSEKIELSLTGNCRITRRFPIAASLTFAQQYLTGKGDTYLAKETSSGDYLGSGGMGTISSACLSGSCVHLNLNASFPYEVQVTGQAGTTPGNYTVTFNMYVTAVGWETYSDIISAVIIKYTVSQPPCTLSSAKTMNLSFGTLSSNDFATNQQVANVTMNCTKGTQVTATLVPTQAAISGSTGVSATTLAGLSMAATWADDGTAVTFSSPRSLTLKTGANTIGLGFRPRLSTSVSPTGSFTSQYTLNITYL